MGLDVGIDLTLVEGATVDCTELAGYLFESPVSAIGVIGAATQMQQDQFRRLFLAITWRNNPHLF